MADLKRLIQADNLNQIVGADNTITLAAMQRAQEEAISYLTQKYDTAKEFSDTLPWDPTNASYNAGSRVYLDAPAYDVTKTYALGAIILQSGMVYSCNTPITTPEAFNSSHWTILGAQYAFFNGKQPLPFFDITINYLKGNQVFWKGKIYTALRDTPIMDHDTVIQYPTTDDIPYTNYFPDDINNGPSQWGLNSTYSIAAGTLPTNTTFWIAGDNRSQIMVEKVTIIAIYALHSRISPQNIPKIREVQYIGKEEDRVALKNGIIYPSYSALGWLQDCARGNNSTAPLPKIQPLQGGRIRYGSNVKQNTTY
jgi:hypothetical protein